MAPTGVHPIAPGTACDGGNVQCELQLRWLHPGHVKRLLDVHEVDIRVGGTPGLQDIDEGTNHGVRSPPETTLRWVQLVRNVHGDPAVDQGR